MAQRVSRIIRLEGPNTEGVRRFLSGLHVQLDEGKKTSWVTVTRTGSFTDPRYGRFEITRPMLLSMVDNFDKRTYGQDIFIDVAHKPADGAAGKVLKLTVEGDRLRALVEWTPFGIQAIKERGFLYLSAEYHENFTDNEQGQPHGPVLLGAGLVVRPCIKKLDPIQLSEAAPGIPTLLHPKLQSELTQEISMKFAELIKALKEKLLSFKLSETVVDAMVSAATKSLEAFTDEAQAKLVLAEFEKSGKQLSEQIGSSPVKLEINLPGVTGGLSAEDVKKLLAEENRRQAAEIKQLAEAKDANLKLLSDTINAVKEFDEDLRKSLTDDMADLVTAETTADQVKRLAEAQIGMGQRLVAAKKLSGMGFHWPKGSVHIETVDESARSLSETFRTNLKKTAFFAQGKLRLSDKVDPFTEKVLAAFDAINGDRLHQEVKILAGETNMGSTSLPVGFQREVIREALSDTNILQLVNAFTDPGAVATTQIPYETRDVSQVYNDGVVYEGQPIHRAGISQAMDTAYIVPTKLALLVSNEVLHFTRASAINWDAYSRNLESNARFVREMLARRIANELQRSADAYAAVAVSAEAFDAQLTGSNSIIKTSAYPIVRPFQARDLQGNAVGSAENPITLVLNGTTITAYDGTNSQAAGTYYRVINYNLGYVQLVNQVGVPATPTDTGTNTISYSRATNVVKVDLDVPGGSTYEKQLNKALQAIGSRKALLSGQRFVTPDFLLCSPTLHDTLTNAEQFEESHARNGSGTTVSGDLETVKGLPGYGTNAPGIDLGDERVLIGQRGILGYSVAKPFQFGDPFEAVDSNGKPIGKKQSYGEEYSAIKVPAAVRNRMTSVLVYSFTNR